MSAPHEVYDDDELDSRRDRGRMHRMDTLRAFHSRLLLAIHGIAEADLRRPEREGKWSIADVIAHLGDLELVYAVRIRTILAGAGGDTPLPALAQDDWVERVHRREPLSELLEQFWFHRRMNLALLRAAVGGGARAHRHASRVRRDHDRATHSGASSVTTRSTSRRSSASRPRSASAPSNEPRPSSGVVAGRAARRALAPATACACGRSGRTA